MQHDRKQTDKEHRYARIGCFTIVAITIILWTIIFKLIL